MTDSQAKRRALATRRLRILRTVALNEMCIFLDSRGWKFTNLERNRDLPELVTVWFLHSDPGCDPAWMVLKLIE